MKKKILKITVATTVITIIAAAITAYSMLPADCVLLR